MYNNDPYKLYPSTKEDTITNEDISSILTHLAILVKTDKENEARNILSNFPKEYSEKFMPFIESHGGLNGEWGKRAELVAKFY